MIKIYTNESNTSKKTLKTPKKSVIENILNYSKALEVLKTTETEHKVEVILN